MENQSIQRKFNYSGSRAPKSRRVINKSGTRNINFLHLPERSRRFVLDFVTTLIEQQWRYVITIFLMTYSTCWLVFAILWYLISYAHGDLMIDDASGKLMNEGSMPCVTGATTFGGFLLFSFELQSSVGFGEKYPNDECFEAFFLMVAQIVIGVAIEGCLLACVYAKMVRPPRRPLEMKFSKKAVISMRDSKLCLQFRVCDPSDIHVIETKVRAYLIEERLSAEGEILHQFHRVLELENEGSIFIIFPLTICHVIDEKSPLFYLSAKSMIEKRFEIVVTLTGGSKSTGQITEERTSYLSKEIMWGYRFNNNIVSYDPTNEVYVTNYENFDQTEEIDTPLCSAKHLDKVVTQIQNYYENKFNARREQLLKGYNAHLNQNTVLKSAANIDSGSEDGDTEFPKEVRFQLEEYDIYKNTLLQESYA